MMIYLNDTDRLFLAHVAEVIGDRLYDEPDEYTRDDRAMVDKLDRLANGDNPSFVLTGEELDPEEAKAVFRDVVEAEMTHWVPGASARLIHRVGKALGFFSVQPRAEDHGPEPLHHPLTSQWLGGLYVRQCCTCARVFPA